MLDMSASVLSRLFLADQVGRDLHVKKHCRQHNYLISKMGATYVLSVVDGPQDTEL